MVFSQKEKNEITCPWQLEHNHLQIIISYELHSLTIGNQEIAGRLH